MPADPKEIDEPLDRLFAEGGEMGALMREVDWTQASVGAPSTWPSSLRNALGLILGSASQLCLLWGRDFTQFYNDAFRPILGAEKHPAAMGQAARETWSEVWDVIAPMYNHVAAGGATSIRDGLLVLRRNGFLEECYFDYTYSAVRDEQSNIAGILAICSEVTERVLGARRLRVLGEATTRPLGAATPRTAAEVVATVLAEATSDISFALIYLYDEDGVLRPSAAAGVGAGAPGDWPLGDGEREVDLDPSRALPGGPWPEPTIKAMSLPLRTGSTGRPHGYLVLGASPRLPFDDRYRDFMRLTGSACAAVIAQADARERETERTAQHAEARVAAEHSKDRSDFLVQVASTLGKGLDVAVALQRLVELIAPDRADFASVWMVRENNLASRIVHAPHREQIVIADRSLTGSRAPVVVQDAIDSGKTQVVEDLLSWFERYPVTESYRQVISDLGIRGVISFPIRNGELVVAALSVAFMHAYAVDAAELAMYEAVCGLVTLSFENSSLYSESKRLREAAEAATVAKDRFLAHVSHELRNPLGAILGWASLLRQGPAQSQVAKGLEVIERSAQSQVRLVEDLLDVSRIAVGKLHLAPSVEDVHSLIDTAIDAARITAAAKKVALNASIDADVGAVVVDPERFRQVIWNLVSNAVKFTPSGGLVTLEAHREKSVLEISITDTGKGIEADFLPRVFDSFEQAEHGAKRTGGLGLGLAIVRHVVELHGGTVTASSEGLGKGSCFTVRIPIRASVALTSATSQGAVVVRLALEGVTVLVVDDETDARDVVAAILEAAGARVIPAGSVLEALELFIQDRPAAVVSDITMPDKDGHDLIRQIRALPAEIGGRTPAIALTAMTRAQNRIEALTAGFNAHVAKPVEPQELILQVARVLGKL